MNGFAEPMSSPPEESRPPVVGKEDSFFEESNSLPVHYLDFLKPNMESNEVTEYDSKNMNGMDGSANEGNELMEQSPSPSPPNPGKWTISLQCLLDDITGTDLFQKYLIMEGQDTKCLDFIFACRGVKKTAPNTDCERLYKLVHVLYEKKVKRIAVISDDTKREIKRKIQSNEIDINIFDVAQRQVEMNISNTTYRTFLMSDLYLQHLSASSEGESTSERDCVVSEEAECLPTLHEDTELYLTEKQQLMLKRESIRRKLQRNSEHLRKSRTEPGSLIKSPYSVNYSSYHARYGTCLPTSVQDSEIQSISSGAQTDDTMSNCDSSVDYSMSRNKPKRLLDGKKYLNPDNLCEVPKNFVTKTQLPDIETRRNPCDFHQELILKLNKVCEERKRDEKMEKLKSAESPEHCSGASGGTIVNQCKMESSVFDIFGPSEDNDQDILDRHVSRVFDDMGQTPVLSPVCTSPPAARPQVDVLPGTSLLGPQDLSYTNYQKSSLVSPFSVIGNPKQKQERDTRSSDSGAVTEWISEDNLASRSHESLVYQKQQASFARSSSKDQSRRSLRKSGPIFKSTTSFEDSGISEVYEPHGTSLKMAHWLESKRCVPENDKEMKNCASPVLNRSSGQKILYRGESVMHNSLTFVSRATVMQPQPTAQDLTTSFRPDTTTNLIEARRRLSRHTSGAPRLRQSFRASDTFEEGLSQRKQSKKEEKKDEAIVIGYSYGQQSVPYLTRFHGRSITLRNFKSLLTKKGNFKYYFKRVDNAFGTGTVLEEVYDDQAILPLWEGKVFCVIETVDDLPTPEDSQ